MGISRLISIMIVALEMTRNFSKYNGRRSIYRHDLCSICLLRPQLLYALLNLQLPSLPCDASFQANSSLTSQFLFPTTAFGSISSQLTGHDRMSSAQATIDSPPLPIDITCLVASQEQSYPCNFIRYRISLQRIELSYLSLRPSRPSH